MYKNYIFDFGNVIIKFDPEYMTAAYIADTDDLALAKDIIFDRLYWDRLDNGTISDTETKSLICSRLPERLHAKACAAYDNWYKNIPFIEGVLPIINEIKQKGGRLFLLSNISRSFAEGYSSVPALKELFDKFDGLVFSGTLGITKPESEIFDHLLEKYSLKAEDCIFIDDSEKNVAGAQKAGIAAHLFCGDTKKLRSVLLG